VGSLPERRNLCNGNGDTECAQPGWHNKNEHERICNNVFSHSSDPAEIYENMVLGGSFIETVATTEGSSSNRTMNLYFSAQDYQVPMGRYPVIVDSDTDTVKTSMS
jgi:hypothetical protein